MKTGYPFDSANHEEEVVWGGRPCLAPLPAAGFPGRPTWRADEGVRRGPGGPPHKCAKQVLAESMDTQFYTNSRASAPNVLLSAMSTVRITGASVAQKAHIEPSVTAEAVRGRLVLAHEGATVSAGRTAST